MMTELATAITTGLPVVTGILAEVVTPRTTELVTSRTTELVSMATVESARGLAVESASGSVFVAVILVPNVVQPLGMECPVSNSNMLVL